jgi:hypothetical protein
MPAPEKSAARNCSESAGFVFQLVAMAYWPVVVRAVPVLLTARPVQRSRAPVLGCHMYMEVPPAN